jgi:hypothetical protein
MLRTNRACATLLLLEDELSQGWRPVFSAGLPGGIHSGGLSFSSTAPVLLLLLHPSGLRGLIEILLVEALKQRFCVPSQPFRKLDALGIGLKRDLAPCQDDSADLCATG